MIVFILIGGGSLIMMRISMGIHSKKEKIKYRIAAKDHKVAISIILLSCI